MGAGAVEIVDNDFGMAGFLRGEPPPPEEGAPGGAKAEGSESEPAKEPAAPAGDPPKETPPAEPAKEEKPPASSAPNWDSDDNPWKKSHAALEKRLNETRDWATKQTQELADIRRTATRAEKKADGTYKPEDDKEPEVDGPTATQIAALNARVNASRSAAIQIYGEEFVNKTIFDPESTYMQKYDKDPGVAARVMNAEAPVLEAIRFMKERELFDKYGDDPEKIRAGIVKELEAETETKIEAEVNRRLKERLSAKGRQPEGVAGTTAAPATSSKDKKEFVAPTLASMVGGAFA